MKHVVAKIFSTLACAIILLHAVVPHHHHDCADEVGIVFETELNCHHSHSHASDALGDCRHHSDHPFDFCHLADMLSHLVLSNKDDDQLTLFQAQADAGALMMDILSVAGALSEVMMDSSCLRLPGMWASPLPQSPMIGGKSLRGPPHCA